LPGFTSGARHFFVKLKTGFDEPDGVGSSGCYNTCGNSCGEVYPSGVLLAMVEVFSNQTFAVTVGVEVDGSELDNDQTRLWRV